MSSPIRNYLIVTGAYWGFTVTDGAIRMLVVLFFHTLGYTPFEVAMLFVLYEACGVVTNAVGGWLGARWGIDTTMHAGMVLQVVALLALTVPQELLTLTYVVLIQALSGVAKDLNKMSAKSSVKTIAAGGSDSRLFKWVAALTGSKNALKGAGFFIGAAGLEWLGFQGTLYTLASALALIAFSTMLSLPRDLGKAKSKPKFSQVFSNTSEVNWLSAARFFLFGARDVWFVVALPVFAYSILGWTFTQVGAFMALWVVGYGFIQAIAPKILSRRDSTFAPGGPTALRCVCVLAAVPALMAWAISLEMDAGWIVIIGLGLFGVVFALNSAVHSYLILAFADNDKVAMNVGFYYMSNAGGRLLGTVLSGWTYLTFGMTGCLWTSAALLAVAAGLTLPLFQHDSS